MLKFEKSVRGTQEVNNLVHISIMYLYHIIVRCFVFVCSERVVPT
jgi:hypothetical protein